MSVLTDPDWLPATASTTEQHFTNLALVERVRRLLPQLEQKHQRHWPTIMPIVK